MASPEWAKQFVQQLRVNPQMVAQLLRATDVMPTAGFIFPNRAGDMQLLVTPYRVSALVRPYDDATDSEDTADGRDALRGALRAAGMQPALTASSAAAWVLHCYDDAADAARGADSREELWASFASGIETAYETRLCACSRQLCRHGARCFQCAVDLGRPMLPAAPAHLSDLAKDAMAGSSGWKSRSERAGLCAIGVGDCPERPSKQLRLDCGHVFCGGCLSRVLGLRCPLCRAPTAGLSTVYYS
jgi:hypothetical protein